MAYYRTDDTPPAYWKGWQARLDGYAEESCPYSDEPSPWGAREFERENSPLCLRCWWLAGYWDAR